MLGIYNVSGHRMWCSFIQAGIEKPCGFCMLVLEFPLWFPYITLEILVVWQFTSGWKREKRSEYLSLLVLSLSLFSLVSEKLEISFACHELGGNWDVGIVETSGNIMMQSVLAVWRLWASMMWQHKQSGVQMDRIQGTATKNTTGLEKWLTKKHW